LVPHPNVAYSFDILAALYHDIGQYEKAAPLLLRALKIRQNSLGNDPPDVGKSLRKLAELYEYSGDHDRADTTYYSAVNILDKSFNP